MTDKPVRLRLFRKSGFNLQEASRAFNGLPAVNVARPSKWGNPYRVGDDDPVTCTPMTPAHAVFWFRADLDPAVSENAERDRAEIRRELAGKNLACWCAPGAPCHADVLLEIANGPICEEVKP